ncbi:MAG TPA: MFS transporter [Acidimicrobiales bacterium]
MTRLRLAASDTFSSLRTRNFRLFFAGQLVSQTGTWMQSVALVWVVLDLTGDGVALGLVVAAQFLPVLVLGAWGGVVADRVDRHFMMIGTQLAFTALAVAFSMLTLTGTATVGAIYALSLLFGIINALDNPSRRALVTELVALRDVPNAVGLNSAVMTGSRVVGPAVAGALIAGPGAGWTFVANAVSYLFVIGALLRMDRSQLRPSPRVARAKGQLREGLRYAWRTPEMRLPIVLVAVIGTLTFEYQVSLPLLAERTFEGTATTFTLLFSTMSAGSVAGALAVARRSRIDLAFLLRAGGWLAAASVALALAPTLAVAVAASVAVGFSSIALISGSNAVVQLEADPAMRGRVLALLSVVFLGSTPIGGPIVGWVSELAGPRAGVLVGAVAAAGAVAWTVRQRRALDTGTPPTGRAAAPVPTPDGASAPPVPAVAGAEATVPLPDRTPAAVPLDDRSPATAPKVGRGTDTPCGPSGDAEDERPATAA